MDFSFSSHTVVSPNDHDNISLVPNERVPILPPRDLSEIGHYKINSQTKPKLVVPVAGLLIALSVLATEEKVVNLFVSQKEKLVVIQPETDFIAKAKVAGKNLDFNLIQKQVADTSVAIGGTINTNLSKSRQGLEGIGKTLNSNWKNFDIWQKGSLVTDKVLLKSDYYLDKTRVLEQKITFFLDEAELKTAAVGINSLLDRNDVNFVNQTLATISNTRQSIQNLNTTVNEQMAGAGLVLATAMVSVENIGYNNLDFSEGVMAVNKIGSQISKSYEQIGSVPVYIDIYAKNISGLIDLADRELMASAEFSAKGLQATAITTREALRAVWYGVPMAIINQVIEMKNNIIDVVVELVDNWRQFLFGTEQNTSEQVAPTGDLREQIRQELINELQGQMNGVFDELRAGRPAVVRQPTVGENGVVVVPAGSSSSNVKSQLQNMFSDPVTVKFDADGQSGIVTPQFKDRTGDNYVFLLTPVKK